MAAVVTTDDDDQFSDEMEFYDTDDVVDSSGLAPDSPRLMSRDEVMSLLGYRKERIATHATVAGFVKQRDSCNRCGKKVYHVERLDVGEIYHKSCFKCCVCGYPLNLKTFHRFTTDAAKEIYCRSHVPKIETSVGHDSIAIKAAVDAQKKASGTVLRPLVYKYDPEALEFQHNRHLKQQQQQQQRQNNNTSSLKSQKDFETFGVFEAQENLEKRQKIEEDDLYHQIFEERQRLLRNLQEFLAKEKEHTVKELIALFEEKGSSKQEQQNGLQKVEQFYRQQLESRVKQMLGEMAVEERLAVDRLIDKHAQEMLVLIQDKQREATDILNSETENKIGGNENYKNIFQPTKNENEEESVRERADKRLDPSPDQKQSQEDLEQEDDEESELVEKENDREEEEEEEEEEDDDDDDDAEETEEMHHDAFDDEAERLKDSFEDVELNATHDKDEFNSDRGNIAMSFETPTDIQINRLQLVTEGSKVNRLQLVTEGSKVNRLQLASDGSKVRSSRDALRPVTSARRQMTDEETQTYGSAKDRHSKHRSNDAEQTKSSRKLTPNYDSKGSPRTPQRNRLPPQFQITVSTERCHRLDDSTHHEREETSPMKTERRSNASTRTTPLKASPRQKRTKDEPEANEDDGLIPALVIPAVRPPKSSKSKLYQTPEIFRELDQRALEEAKKDPLSFTDLVRRLSRKCESDLQKVRAIFRWITAKDLNRMKFSETEISDSPMGLLRGIKSGTESYHNLFKRLCSYAGLHCKVIEGYSKGAGYRPGSKFGKGRFRNQWTAVWVDDSWRFVNCNWGARHVKRTDDRMTYKIDEFYFMTDPEEHIYQHFPDDSRWQLLEKPITLEEFVDLPVVKSPFFNSGLKFVSKVKSVLRAHAGQVELRLQAPRVMTFAAKLKPKDANVSRGNLKESCLVRIINNQVVFLVDIPLPGHFYFEVFVESDRSIEAMDNVCSFRVHCSRVSDHQSYPQVGCFGKLPICERYRISERSDYDPLIISSGQLAMTFKVPKESLRLSHSLQFWRPQEKVLLDFTQFAFLRSRQESGVEFLLHLPQKGIYVLSLYLVDPAATQKTKPVVFYRSLINCVEELAHACPLPRSSSKWVGCKLIEPVSGDLASKSKVMFKVESKSASEVLASVGGQWISLEKNSRATWQALVPTGEKSGKLCLYGRFNASEEKYTPLWEFSVKESTVVDEVQSLFKYL